MTFKFSYLLVLFPFILLSQNIRFDGIVKAPDGITLEMANVIAINQDTKSMDGYAVTDGTGRFRINLKANSTYTIKVSYIGFEAFEETLITQTSDIQKIITLKEGDSLDGVEIVHEMPVSVQGDTIIYNADSFKTGEERKLEDVLKKLPGVEINEDGDIQVEGKRVSKLFVDGKPFFEGDTKLGAKNIPSDAVDKVQVLRNFNEVSQMRGLENNNDDVAMNIKLKKGKDKFWFGDIGAGIANDKGFIVNPKIFYYSPKTSVNTIGNWNNIGEVSLTARDFGRLTGGSRNTIGRSGTSLNFNRNSIGLSGGDQVAKMFDRFGAGNVNHTFSKALTATGFAAYSSTFSQNITNSERGIYRPNTTDVATLEDRNTQRDSKNKSFIAKLGTKYKPNPNFQLDYDVFMRRSGQEDVNFNTTSSTTFFNGNAFNDANNVVSFERQDPVSFNQSVNMFYTQNTKTTWVLELQHQYADEDPFFRPELSNNPYQNFSSPNPDDPSNIFVNENTLRIEQSRFVKTNRFDAKVDYYYQVNNKSVLNLTLGNTNAYQAYNSSILQILENNSINEINNANYLNDVQYYFNDAYVAMHYKFILGKFTFNPGVSLHQYNTRNEQISGNYPLNFTRILPDAFARWDIKRSENLTYDFAMRNVFNDVNSLVEGYVFNNFNSISRGNPLLENALSTSHNLRYSKYNLFNYTTIFANLNYTTTKDPIVTSPLFQGIYSISDRFNIDAENENLNGNFFYSRNFKKYYKASARINANWNRNFVLNRRIVGNDTETILQDIETTNHGYTLSFGTQFKKLPNIDLSYSINFSEQANNKFNTQTPNIRMNYNVIEGLNVSWDYALNRFKNENNGDVNNFEIMSAAINYIKKDSRFEYRIQANNLLNTRARLNNSFNVNGFSANENFILPRFVTFILKYNLQ